MREKRQTTETEGIEFHTKHTKQERDGPVINLVTSRGLLVGTLLD